MPLDRTDLRLLALLEANARASVVSLARDLGLWRSATQERLGRLERTGAIAGYTLVRGPGVPSGVEALLLVSHDDTVTGTSLGAAIGRLTRCARVRNLAGKPDMAVILTGSDMDELSRMSATIRDMPGVMTVATHIVLPDPGAMDQSP